MTQSSLPVSGNFDINFLSGGLFLTDIYYGDTPVSGVLLTLSGGSNNFTKVQFQLGASLFNGSIIIGSSAPSGVMQVFDLENQDVLISYEPPVLSTDNIEDVS